MFAHTDESLNTQYGTVGPPGIVVAFAPYLSPILEPGFAPYNEVANHGTVYAAPALIPTAAVGYNPWDHVFGPLGANAGSNPPVPALRTPPQVGSESFA